MGVSPTSSPPEFGDALRAARERAGVGLPALIDRTKISKRVLEALEAGEFGKLPDRVFVRMFLVQYLEILKEAAPPWLTAFDHAWQHHLQSSQSFRVHPSVPIRRHRVGPWVVGIMVVVVAVLALVLVEKRQNGGRPGAPPPTPEALLPVLAPTPTPAPAVPAAAPTPVPAVLRLVALDRECWVEVRVEGRPPESRLLAPGTSWEVAAEGRPVDLVVGDAGALSVAYLGDVRAHAGRDGDVVHLHLGPSRTPPPSRS